MNDIHILKKQILYKISCQNIDVIDEFNNAPIPKLTDKPTVCIYLKGMALSSSMLGDFAKSTYGQSTISSTSAKRATIKLGLNIYCKDATCDAVFARLAPTLLFDNEIDAKNINCISMEYKSALKAYILQSEMELERLMALDMDSAYFNGFSLNINNKETV